MIPFALGEGAEKNGEETVAMRLVSAVFILCLTWSEQF